MAGSSVLLIRHGETDVKAGFDVPVMYGPNEPLTDRGSSRASRLGALLARTGTTPDIIITSGFERAGQTARILADTLPNKPGIVTDTRINGARIPQWDHRPVSEFKLADENIFSDNPVLPDLHGETEAEAQGRVTEAYRYALRTYPDKTIAFVAHGEIIDLLLTAITGKKHNRVHGTENMLDKGNALFLRVDGQGNLVERRLISPEGFTPHPEIRR